MVIGLQHLILKENNYNQKNLTISVSTNFISLSESDFSTNSLITFKKKSFDNPISVENITDELGTMLDKNNIKKMIKKLSSKEIVNLISQNSDVSKKKIYNFCLKIKNES